MATPTSTGAIAPDTKGQNFFMNDRTLQDLARLYLDDTLCDAIWPQLKELGQRVANDLDDHAMLANRHPPVLHQRDKYGRDRQWIEYHSSYRTLEQAAFGDFALHAMSHRPTLANWDQPLPVFAKHLFTFLFNQAEFGLGCPINVTDSAAHVIRLFGSEELKQRLLPRMLSADLDELWQGAQFITEQAGGSDVGQVTTRAVLDQGEWRLYGDKWFCSNADADIAMILARPHGAEEGIRGLALFAMPRNLENGDPNHIRIVRLKEKFGTRSMASGELRMDGALAYLVGEENEGLKQMLEMINWSRLSNGVKSAALMRRAVHDANTVSKHRVVFGKTLMELPLARRQLLKLCLASEQSMSMWAFVANQLDVAERGGIGSNRANSIARLATPILKMRGTRDARQVCGDAMEVRGGCGYVEDFVNPRLVRDAHLGSIWEGTSNIIAIDAVRRAINQNSCLPPLVAALQERIEDIESAAPSIAMELRECLGRVEQAAFEVAEKDQETRFRSISTALYHVCSAILMAWEGVEIERLSGDASRLLWARLAIDHKVVAQDPLNPAPERADLCDLLLKEKPVPLTRARELVA
ncbi:MAG: acyl-CoA dehydrogenase family protein [Gammaproteobacteria bacterium]|nr:acyl-CoA dehydrogenase family protein [Gammaproteobacteria bacterium]